LTTGLESTWDKYLPFQLYLLSENEHNMTKKQIHDEEVSKRLSKYTDEIWGSGPRLSKEEIERRHMQWAKEKKIQRRKRKMLGGGPMSPKESWPQATDQRPEKDVRK
jgi:hypothetical protein